MQISDIYKIWEDAKITLDIRGIKRELITKWLLHDNSKDELLDSTFDKVSGHKEIEFEVISCYEKKTFSDFK